MEHIPIPAEIKAAYLDQEPEAVKILGGGIINTTLLVLLRPSEKIIMQQLHPIIEPTQTADYQIISQHLRRDGWEIPALVPTKDGALYATAQDGKHWRAFEFVDSDSSQGAPMVSYGTILGRLHRSLGSLAYTPQFRIPHFHDTKHYAKVLEESLPHLTNSSAQSSAEFVLREFANSIALPEIKEQIIHADPKTENILTRNGVPFTFIDWDTAMKSSPWIDIGDMLRSVMNQNRLGKPYRHPLNGTYEIIEGYQQIVSPGSDPGEFRNTCFQATGAIVLELAMRYLADYQDGDKGYFSWDSTRFASRHDHNSRRAFECLLDFNYLKELKEDSNRYQEF